MDLQFVVHLNLGMRPAGAEFISGPARDKKTLNKKSCRLEWSILFRNTFSKFWDGMRDCPLAPLQSWNIN